MTRRAHIWFLIAILVLALGTTIALTRQQANFNEHRKIANEACQLALTNRKVIRDLVVVEEDETEHAEQAAALRKIQADVEALIKTSNCKD